MQCYGRLPNRRVKAGEAAEAEMDKTHIYIDIKGVGKGIMPKEEIIYEQSHTHIQHF